MTTLDPSAEARRRIVSRVFDEVYDAHLEDDLRAGLSSAPTCQHPECVIVFCGPELPWQPGDWGEELPV
jgi:hypothetical protein